MRKPAVVCTVCVFMAFGTAVVIVAGDPIVDLSSKKFIGASINSGTVKLPANLPGEIGWKLFSPGGSSGFSTNLLFDANEITEVPWAKLADSRQDPVPGVYWSKPYSMVEIVPRETDPGMVVAAGGNSISSMPVITPDVELEKK